MNLYKILHVVRRKTKKDLYQKTFILQIYGLASFQHLWKVYRVVTLNAWISIPKYCSCCKILQHVAAIWHNFRVFWQLWCNFQSFYDFSPIFLLRRRRQERTEEWFFVLHAPKCIAIMYECWYGTWCVFIMFLLRYIFFDGIGAKFIARFRNSWLLF